MSNESGINPVGWRVLIKPQEVREVSEGGIILTTEVTKDREQMGNTTGVVIAMGDQCYADEPAPWCAVGDKVIFAKYAGIELDEDHVFLNETDILAIKKD